MPPAIWEFQMPYAWTRTRPDPEHVVDPGPLDERAGHAMHVGAVPDQAPPTTLQVMFVTGIALK
jgi:hypothetical protein